MAALPVPADNRQLATLDQLASIPAARPLEEKPKRGAPEPRIGITIRLPEAVHERLRLLAFEQRSSKQALIDAWVSERLSGG